MAGSGRVLGLLLGGGAAWMLNKVSDFRHRGVDLLAGQIETHPNNTSEGEACVGSSNSDSAELPATKPSRPRERLPPPKWGDHITVLSIDGGGIRGLIPSVILASLEQKLKDVEKAMDKHGDWEDARIADYFDVIAGTSTGGLIAAMLTTPDKTTGRPKTAAEIEGHYREIGPQIFSPRGRGLWHSLKSFVSGPDYDNTFLHDEIKRVTSDHTLANTITNVLMPAFDIRRLYPIIFSSYDPPYDPLPGQPKEKKSYLIDVCKGTSAAPTYFSAHHFQGVNENDEPQEEREFHLIDGGVGANNPTMAAIMRITREVLCRNKDFKPVLNYKDFVVISIGTGSTRQADRAVYNAEDCAKWGHIDWIHSKVENCDKCSTTIGWIPGKAEDREKWGPIGRILNKAEDYTKLIHKYKEHRTRKPIIDMLMHASDFLVDFDVAMLLRSQGGKHYLRIQTEVEERNLSMDDAAPKNLQELTDIGHGLLKKNISRVSLITGRYQEVRSKNSKVPTNEEELLSFARTLVEERKRRFTKRSASGQRSWGFRLWSWRPTP